MHVFISELFKFYNQRIFSDHSPKNVTNYKKQVWIFGTAGHGSYQFQHPLKYWRLLRLRRSLI